MFDFLLKKAEPIKATEFRLNSLSVDFPIESSDRVTLIGKTGCGKTTVAEQLLNNQPGYAIVIDPKGMCNWEGWHVTEKPSRVSADLLRHKHIIFKPPITWSFSDYDNFFAWIYKIRNIIAYIDEVFAVASETTRPSSWLGAIATRGRQLNIGLWCATQRPARVPIFLLSEADHFLMFHLKLPVDIGRVYEIAEMTKEEQLKMPMSTRQLKKRHFYYHNSEREIMRGPLTLDLQNQENTE
jgi:ABC-type oligopeptide transport system ATPase subunit